MLQRTLDLYSRGTIKATRAEVSKTVHGGASDVSKQQELKDVLNYINKADISINELQELLAVTVFCIQRGYLPQPSSSSGTSTTSVQHQHLSPASEHEQTSAEHPARVDLQEKRQVFDKTLLLTKNAAGDSNFVVQLFGGKFITRGAAHLLYAITVRLMVECLKPQNADNEGANRFLHMLPFFCSENSSIKTRMIEAALLSFGIVDQAELVNGIMRLGLDEASSYLSNCHVSFQTGSAFYRGDYQTSTPGVKRWLLPSETSVPGGRSRHPVDEERESTRLLGAGRATYGTGAESHVKEATITTLAFMGVPREAITEFMTVWNRGNTRRIDFDSQVGTLYPGETGITDAGSALLAYFSGMEVPELNVNVTDVEGDELPHIHPHIDTYQKTRRLSKLNLAFMQRVAEQNPDLEKHFEQLFGVSILRFLALVHNQSGQSLMSFDLPLTPRSREREAEPKQQTSIIPDKRDHKYTNETSGARSLVQQLDIDEVIVATNSHETGGSYTSHGHKQSMPESLLSAVGINYNANHLIIHDKRKKADIQDYHMATCGSFTESDQDRVQHARGVLFEALSKSGVRTVLSESFGLSSTRDRSVGEEEGGAFDRFSSAAAFHAGGSQFNPSTRQLARSTVVEEEKSTGNFLGAPSNPGFQPQSASTRSSAVRASGAVVVPQEASKSTKAVVVDYRLLIANDGFGGEMKLFNSHTAAMRQACGQVKVEQSNHPPQYLPMLVNTKLAAFSGADNTQSMTSLTSLIDELMLTLQLGQQLPQVEGETNLQEASDALSPPSATPTFPTGPADASSTVVAPVAHDEDELAANASSGVVTASRVITQDEISRLEGIVADFTRLANNPSSFNNIHTGIVMITLLRTIASYFPKNIVLMMGCKSAKDRTMSALWESDTLLQLHHAKMARAAARGELYTPFNFVDLQTCQLKPEMLDDEDIIFLEAALTNIVGFNYLSYTGTGYLNNGKLEFMKHFIATVPELARKFDSRELCHVTA